MKCGCRWEGGDGRDLGEGKMGGSKDKRRWEVGGG